MSSDENTVTSITLEQTADIAMSIDEVLAEHDKIINMLTAGKKDRMLLLRDLLMNAYVRGFFAGMQHTLKDIRESNPPN